MVVENWDAEGGTQGIVCDYALQSKLHRTNAIVIPCQLNIHQENSNDANENSALNGNNFST